MLECLQTKCGRTERRLTKTDPDPKTSIEQSDIKTNNAINVTSRVFTRKTAPPLGGHFHDDWAQNVTSIETNFLTKFHEDWTKNVTPIVFTCFHYMHLEKIAKPAGGQVFTPIWTIF
ncbi:hypothetical protein DPMN_110104 [Dreissena polymorpha]|uniref:Uncharacterized protein n=1 Tax=Dreissena polymorpha TaxID=45954 RepID=A0A9D4QNP4_DREPO|nr:hypothetical protein DPMN_110104 [Dreissena polymorpha]